MGGAMMQCSYEITIGEGTAVKKMGNRSAARLFLTGPLVLLVGCLLGAGCVSVPQSPVTPGENAAASSNLAEINRRLDAAAQQPSEASADYRLGPEDGLQITLFNVPESEAGVTPRRIEVQVSQNGSITLPLLGDIQVTGSTTSDLQEVLRQRYKKYVRNPQVGVRVMDYRGQRISVMGAVRNSGVFQLTGPKTLSDLLAMAGGVSDKAGTQVHLYRQGPEGRQSFIIDLLALVRDPGAVSMPVQSGDMINVPQAGMFFVDGAVRKPGSYAIARSYTLTQALATAGGVNEELAKTSGIAILRRRDGFEADRTVINLGQVLAGSVPDPHIDADDVIFVPTSTGKYLVRRFLGGIGLGTLPIP